ncbi:dehydrogenase [Coprinopsis marcescibilis]|uniref:Dehydrogenase n=1 Tax=Coprinopsis marcescibilis TaxID=230819 RepID=A0A5C3KXK5_COPMA|nr:dehydrogenase [Coprinopsis marcescibilis]
MLPEAMRALVSTGNGKFELKQVPVPRPGPHEVIVKVVAAAGNHTDWKASSSSPGNVIGADFSGIIVELGSDVQISVRQIGQRVSGCVRGNVTSNGAFAEYVRADAKLLISLPDDITFEAGAQIGVSVYAACQGLYQALQLPSPLDNPSSNKPTDILIWSGTSFTGHFAIQLAKQAGMRVISTASPQHFDQVKALGADLVFDYSDSFTARKVVTETKGTLTLALDCISEGMTPAQISACLNVEGSTKIATVLPYNSRKKHISTELVWVYSMWGEELAHPLAYPAHPEHYTNAVWYSQLITDLLAQKRLQLGNIKVFPRGLASVESGCEYMKSGKVHAEKIIYRIEDTPEYYL